MLSALEEAAVSYLTTKMAAAANKIDVQRGIEGIPVQAVYVSVDEGKFTRVTDETYRVDVTMYVDVVFSNLQSEKQRRKGIHPIMEGVLQYLFGQKLDLEIKPLVPKAFRNTTTQEIKEKGLISYTLEMATSYHVKRLPEEEADDLLTIGLNYYLQDPVDDGVVDAVDIVTWDAVVLAESGIDVTAESGETITVE